MFSHRRAPILDVGFVNLMAGPLIASRQVLGAFGGPGASVENIATCKQLIPGCQNHTKISGKLLAEIFFFFFFF